MPRQLRSSPAGIPQHIIQRGNNRQRCFADRVDFAVFLSCLNAASRRYCVDVHAWVLMTNHMHLLVTPQRSKATSAMMQSVGRDYVSWFNKRHERTGTLWDGRFKSSLIDTDQYLFCCYRYIELNPVRAGMAAKPGDYPWSSFRANAWGQRSKILVPHALYLQLGASAEARAAAYRAFFATELDDQRVQEIRRAVNTGGAFGSESFIKDCEHRLGRRFRSGTRGRPARRLTKETGSDPINSLTQEMGSDPI